MCSSDASPPRQAAVLIIAILLAMMGTAALVVADSDSDSSSHSDLSPITTGIANRPQTEERLSFQAQEPFRPRVRLNADVAMVYGIDKTLPDRIKTWRDAGYTIHVMTGVAWGEYQDYYFGRWDGKHREDEGQRQKNGEIIGHGGDVYYMSPGDDYGRYLSEGVKRALDAGAEAIHLEEPEYWVRAGWEGNFKRQWQKYYNEPWIEPDSSPNAQYRASKLKYYLYRRALADVFEFVKAYGKEHGRDIKCYVPTHSMINYASWGIVSPESSLLEVGADGFIAQVWTGTARTPNFYDGVRHQRTFETAFLEYGAMQNIVRASKKRVWYLNDPIEDNPNHSWWDYRTNWESTLIASLLQPEVWHYEIMPWPHRIFEHDYPTTQPHRGQKDVERAAIPDAYATELQAVISAMGDMRQPSDRVTWERVGTLGAGVLVSDTLMFQRFGPDASDPDLGHFYGLALPLLMCGLPVEPVQIENADLNRYKTLLLSYEGQKPPMPEFHDRLAAWVKAGGALVVIDDDRDPFNDVREWWNTGDMKCATPRHHLFDKLGLKHDATGEHSVGRGYVVFEKRSPAQLSRTKGGAEIVRADVKRAIAATGQTWKESPALVLRRGAYVIAAGLGQPTGESRSPVILKGNFIPLFDADQPVVHEFAVGAGARGLLVDLDRFPKDYAGVVAAACRVTNEKVTTEAITFDTIGQAKTNAVVSVLLPAAPKAVKINGVLAGADAVDYRDGVLRIRFAIGAEPISVAISR